MNLSAQQMHPVQYTRNDGISIAANVYTPAGHDKSKNTRYYKKWFAHLAIMDVQKAKTEWKEPVSEKEYTQLTK